MENFFEQIILRRKLISSTQKLKEFISENEFFKAVTGETRSMSKSEMESLKFLVDEIDRELR